MGEAARSMDRARPGVADPADEGEVHELRRSERNERDADRGFDVLPGVEAGAST